MTRVLDPRRVCRERTLADQIVLVHAHVMRSAAKGERSIIVADDRKTSTVNERLCEVENEAVAGVVSEQVLGLDIGPAPQC